MPLLNRNRMSLIVGLGELQTFSFRFTQRLNMFCFELTGRLLRVNTFFSLTHGFQLNSYDAPVATSASNSSKRLDTSICCVCVYVYETSELSYKMGFFFFHIKIWFRREQKAIVSITPCIQGQWTEERHTQIAALWNNKLQQLNSGETGLDTDLKQM